MIATCVRCNAVVFRYAPLDERRRVLCGACTVAQTEVEQRRLSCGHYRCIYPVVPYECLFRAAAEQPLACPGEVRLSSP